MTSYMCAYNQYQYLAVWIKGMAAYYMYHVYKWCIYNNKGICCACVSFDRKCWNNMKINNCR